jgi:hypothetical protein
LSGISYSIILDHVLWYTVGGPGRRTVNVLQALAKALRWCEDLVSLVSGPVLLVGLGIGLVDLLTDGKLLISVPALLFAWAISQVVGVDAYLVVIWDHAARSFRAGKYGTATVLSVFGLVLAYVAFVAAQVFSLAQTYGMTTNQALATLGMSPLAWLFQRNVLAVFLVIVFACSRAFIGQESVAEEKARLERETDPELVRLRREAARVNGEPLKQLAGSVLTRIGVKTSQEIPTPIRPRVVGRNESLARRHWTPGMTGYKLQKLTGMPKTQANKWAAVLNAEQAA